MEAVKIDIKKQIEGILDFVRNSEDLDRVMVALSEEDGSELLKLALNEKLKNSGFRAEKVVRDLGKFNFYLAKRK